MSIFTKFGAWIAKVFKSVKTDGAKIAVAITEGIQTALKSGVVEQVAKIIEGIFPGVQHIPEEVVSVLNKVVPKVLAAELAIQGLPDNPSEQDILDFEKRVLDAFGVHDDKSKLYSTLAAQIYAKLKEFAGEDKVTFAELVVAVEEAYQEYLQDVQDAEINPDLAPAA